MPPTPMTAFVRVSLGGELARAAQDVARDDGQRGRGGGGAPGELPTGDSWRIGTWALLSTRRRRIIVTTGMETPDPLDSFHAALEARHLSELTFAEVRRALQALSSLYVERRERMADGAALDGAGKRAAFALYYGPLHFLLVREIVRALSLRAAPPDPRPRLRHRHRGRGVGARGRAEAPPRGRRPQRLGRRGGPLDLRPPRPRRPGDAGRRDGGPPARSRRPASSPRSP